MSVKTGTIKCVDYKTTVLSNANVEMCPNTCFEEIIVSFFFQINF